MSPFVLVLFVSGVLLVRADELTAGSAREEKLRSALIDAFQNIKKASAKGGFDDEGPLTSDLIGSISGRVNISKEKPTTEEALDLFGDEDGLTFAEAFGDEVEGERKTERTLKLDNVQHIVKVTKPLEKSTLKPAGNIISKISDSIRTAVNETRNNLQLRAPDNVSHHDDVLLGMDHLLRVFDAKILTSQWKDLQKTVSGECRANLKKYVDGLTEKQLWAMKSE